MTYEEATQHLEISPTEARREIEKQGEDWQEFVERFWRTVSLLFR